MSENNFVTKITSTTIKELTKSSIIMCLIVFAIGLGLIPSSLYFLISTSENLYILPLTIGAFFLIISIIIFIRLFTAIKKADTAELEVKVSFEKDKFNVTSIKKKEVILQEEYGYSNILSAKVTDNYIFVYVRRNRAIPLVKTQETICFLKTKNVKIK